MKTRIYFLDNLRTFLIFLVVLFAFFMDWMILPGMEPI